MNPDEELVDAGPVIEHVRTLYRKGMALNLMNKFAGTQVNKFYLGYYRDEKNRRIDIYRCRARTARKILAIEFQRDDIGEGFSGELVRRHRLAAGISLSSLARLLDMDPHTVRRWEHGKNTPRYRHQVEKVAALLGVPYEAFFGPVTPAEDAYTEEPEQLRVTAEDDFIMSGYPCGVCGVEFKSRIKLRTHAHKGAG